MKTEWIDDERYPKGAWAQLEAMMVCAGHSVHVYLKGGYATHDATCRNCGRWYFVRRASEVDPLDPLTWFSGHPNTCSGYWEGD